jgi:Holliday junction resolvase RusA-like endonuclease
VRGVPQPKGSTRAFNIPGLKAPVVTSANPNLKHWQIAVANAVSRECYQVLEGPIRVTAKFQLPRPASRKKALYHQTKPDLDKLIRAINDAMTKIAYKDDSQVVSIGASKRYCMGDELPGVNIQLESFE